MRDRLRKKVFGDFPKAPRPNAKLGKPVVAGALRTTPLLLYPEPKVPLPVLLRFKTGPKGRVPACILLHLEGKDKALEHPLAAALVDQSWVVFAPDLRGTGETKPAHELNRLPPDHNSAEHALWIGRPLLGQWVFDVSCLLNWMAIQPNYHRDRLAVLGIGQAGVIALCVGGLFDDQLASTVAVDAPATYITEEAYGRETRMGLLAPGILRVGDIPHLAALTAPRQLIVSGGVTPQGKKLAEKQLLRAFSFTRGIYKLHKAEGKLQIGGGIKAEEVAKTLGK
jgi:pimeloyl-ACP methyl ester carboxylesterase